MKNDISIIFGYFQPKIRNLRKTQFFRQSFSISCPDKTTGGGSLRGNIGVSQTTQNNLCESLAVKTASFTLKVEGEVSSSKTD